MNVTYIISVIAFLIIASLIVSSMSYSRQKKIARIQKRLNSLKKITDEALAHLQLLLQIDPSYELILVLQMQAIKAFEQMLELTPNDPTLSAMLSIHKQNLKSYQDSTRNNEVVQFLSSDSALTSALSQLLQLVKVIEIDRNRNAISEAHCARLTAHINELKLNLEIESHKKQAEVFGEKGDLVMYQLHIKKAREAVKRSPIDPKKKALTIKQLTDILNEVKKTNQMPADTEEKPKPET